MKLCKVLLVSASFTLAACAANEGLSQRMAAWQGQPIGVATAVWGTPQAETGFGDQTVLVWRDFGAGPEGMPELLCERMLAVAADGVISGWRWRGDACPSIGAETAAVARLNAL